MRSVIRHIFLLLPLIILLAGIFPGSAGAVKWHALTSSSRYQVALDDESVRLTPLGRLAVWLRFTPLGDVQRKAAAAEYEAKGYRSHLEYYEIDCSEQSAILGLIDVFGATGNRLKRLKGGGEPDAIIPGTVLNRVSERICPTLDDEAAEDETETASSEDGNEAEQPPNKPLSPEAAHKIEELVRITVTNPASHEAWTLLGNAYFDADLPDEAITAYGRALTIRPDDTNVLNDQGAMYRQKGNFSSAIANFEKAVKVDPNNLESLYNCGHVYAFDLNNIAKALQIWKRYLEIDPESETARQIHGFIDRYQK